MSDTPLDPVRPTAAIERGEWVIDELHGWGTLASIVPPRFESYARIFHAASARTRWWTGEESDPPPINPRITNRVPHSGNVHQERWAEAARRWGTVFHPQAQWGSIIAAYRQPGFGMDGLGYSEPRPGRMELGELAVVAGVLARHTTTPGDCIATLWEGHGELYASATWVFVADASTETSAGDSAEEEETPRSGRVEPDPAMARALRNPRLDMPGRPSLMFELDVRALEDTRWAKRSGWVDGLDIGALTPQSIWPDDRAWFLASEIDFDSTIVAGTPELIRDVLALAATGAIEALEIPADADLTITGDRINPMPEQPDYT